MGCRVTLLGMRPIKNASLCMPFEDNRSINSYIEAAKINRHLLLLFCLLALAAHAQADGSVTVGTLAVRPTVCSLGDLYVASDTNLIYQCGPANTWTMVPNLNAANSFTGNNTHSGTETFSGGSPWFDVTGAQFGAKCDGSTPDDSAIQAALTAANAQGGGTVFSPPGKTCIIASNLNENGFIGVKVIGGFGTAVFVGNKQATWKFTGTCASGPCLSIRKASWVNFSNIALSFNGAKAAPMVDITGSNTIGFHGVAFGGPSATSSLGPIVLDETTNSVRFDGRTSFAHAGVFVEGPTNNTLLSDATVFSDVVFENPTVAAIENASVAWVVRDSVYQMAQPGRICAPFLKYVGTPVYKEEQTLLIEGSIFNDAGGDCTNTFSVFTLPAVTGNLGGATFISNLFIPGNAPRNQTQITVGNGQSLTAYGNLFSRVGTAIALGTGVSVNIGPNVYSEIGTFMTGTPQAGVVTDNTGNMFFYSGANAYKLANGNLSLAGSPQSQGSVLVANQGTACTDAQLATTSGWGTGATVAAAVGTGQTCEWTVTAGISPSPNPTLTWTLPSVLPAANTVCSGQVVGGTQGFPATINNSTLSAIAPVFTYNGTPTAGATLFVLLRCGP
jgi:hypothetical protein